MEKERSHADSQITQRRPSPPSTGWSRSPGTGGRDQSERLVAINRNGWSRSIGTAGRDHPVRAGIAQAAIEGDTVRLSHSLFQPMAAEDVATAVAEAAVAEPVNGTIEIAGPDAFPIDEIVGKVLEI